MLNLILDITLPPSPTPTPITPNPFWQNSTLTGIATWIGIGVAILVGIATIVASIVIAVWVVRKQRFRKEIAYQILDDLSIISKMPIEEESIGKQVENRLKIVFDSRPVEDLRVVSLKVWNSGDVDAEIWNSKDGTTGHGALETPIKFEFPGRQIVSGVVETNPLGIIESDNLQKYVSTYLTPAPTKVGLVKSLGKYFKQAQVKIGTVNPVAPEGSASNILELPPCILKPGHSIILRLLLIGPKSDIKKDGKLVDWTIVDFDPEKMPINVRIIPLAIFAISLIAIYFFISWISILPFVLNIQEFFSNSPVKYIIIGLVILLIVLILREEIVGFVKKGVRIRW